MSVRKCTKGLFYFLNALLVLCGLTAVGVGVWVFVDAENFTHIAGVQALDLDNTETCGLILLVCGAGMVLFSAVGIAGAKYNNLCLMAMYLLLLVVLLGVQLITVILGAFLRKEVEEQLEVTLRNQIRDTYSGPRGKDLFSQTFNLFMFDMKCCGLTNATRDFVYDEQLWNRTLPDGRVQLVPSQCCLPSYQCEAQPRGDNSNTEGCLDLMWDTLDKYHTVIISISAIVVSLLFLLVILDVLLIGQRRRK